MTATLPAQTYRERPPLAALAPCVSSVWVQWVSPEHSPYRHRTVPNGSAEVVGTLGSPPRILGPQTVPRVELVAPGSTVVGVRPRVGAASAVLGVPIPELVDLELDTGELWGKRPAPPVEDLQVRRGTATTAAPAPRVLA